MRAFLIEHIDALISTASGLFVMVYSWQRRDRLRASPKKIVRALPILGLLVVVFGLLRFVFDSHPSYAWQRVSTSDRRASAEFPCATTTDSTIDSALGVSIRRLIVNCNVPQRDINLRLSYNEIPSEGAALTVSQRIDALRGFFQQQGFSILSFDPENIGEVPCYRIVMDKDQGHSRCLIRVAISPKAIYRVVATSSFGFHDDPVIDRFIKSFILE